MPCFSKLHQPTWCYGDVCSTNWLEKFGTVSNSTGVHTNCTRGNTYNQKQVLSIFNATRPCGIIALWHYCLVNSIVNIFKENIYSRISYNQLVVPLSCISNLCMISSLMGLAALWHSLITLLVLSSPDNVVKSMQVTVLNNQAAYNSWEIT